MSSNPHFPGVHTYILWFSSYCACIPSLYWHLLQVEMWMALNGSTQVGAGGRSRASLALAFNQLRHHSCSTQTLWLEHSGAAGMKLLNEASGGRDGGGDATSRGHATSRPIRPSPRIPTGQGPGFPRLGLHCRAED